MCDFLWLFGSNMPLEPLCKEKKRNLLPHQKWPWGSNFCEPHFLDLSLKEHFTSSFLLCGNELYGRVEWDWHMGMSYLTSLNPHLFKNSICWVFLLTAVWREIGLCPLVLIFHPTTSESDTLATGVSCVHQSFAMLCVPVASSDTSRTQDNILLPS